MKQLLSIIGTSFVLATIIIGGCGWSAVRTTRAIINNQFPRNNINFKIFSWCFNGLPFIDQLSQILNNKNYIVILQNNTELRPSGGFMGSYGVLSTKNSGLSEVRVQDIYVPDGQLVGHVDPPLPIEQAFGQGWWKLRDANWDPDFKIAGEQIAWFFDQGNEPADSIIAVNLSLVHDWLLAIGPVKPLDYPETITSNNLIDLAQKYSETNAFPGSTQKKDFLGAVGQAMVAKTKQAGPVQLLKLGKIIFTQLKNRQILLWFKDKELEQVAAQRHWDGGLKTRAGDYLYIVETNLGANKANCCVSRKVVQEIDKDKEKIVIDWKNVSPFSNPLKSVFWGGDYIDYVRVIIPQSATVSSVSINHKNLVLKPLSNQFGIQEDRYEIETRDDLQIIGFWAKLPASQSVTADINYQSPRYKSMLVRRQPGIDSFYYQLSVSDKIIYQGHVKIDQEIKF